MVEDERYDYFIRKAADLEEIWGLNDNGWALIRTIGMFMADQMNLYRKSEALKS